MVTMSGGSWKNWHCRKVNTAQRQQSGTGCSAHFHILITAAKHTRCISDRFPRFLDLKGAAFHVILRPNWTMWILT